MSSVSEEWGTWWIMFSRRGEDMVGERLAFRRVESGLNRGSGIIWGREVVKMKRMGRTGWCMREHDEDRELRWRGGRRRPFCSMAVRQGAYFLTWH